jgi:cell division protein FtsW (lipid II flippase)
VLLAGGYLAGWAVVRWTARGADPVLLPTAAILGGLGVAMLYRIMVDRGEPQIWKEQAVWLGVGLVVFVLVLVLIRDIRQLDAYTYTLGLAGVMLLLLPIVPGVGYEINGARLWAHVGSISFQPAEFGKILIVVFLASYLSSKRELLASGVGPLGMPRAKDLGPLVLAWGASLAVLFLERDMGASLLFFGVFVVMIWVASGRPGYLVVGAVLFVAGAVIGYLAFSHVQTRVEYWLHALDPATVHDIGYGQLAQGWFALSSGGLVGTGLGQGSPTLIPYVGSDFIFAAFGEELGMVGAAGLLLLYLVLIGRGLRIGLERVDAFGKLLATGLTTILALQTFAIVAGVTRLIPLTGVPLPLVSYGGSSRVATFVMLALLVRISAGPWERSRG